MFLRNAQLIYHCISLFHVILFRIGVDLVAETVRKLSMGRVTWEEVTKKFPKFEAQETKS